MPSSKTSSEHVGGGGRRSKPNQGCKRHPKHRQSPGVCSLCLADKLSRLSTHSSSYCYSSTSSSLSSSSYSSCSSSPFRAHRFSADGRGPSFCFLLFNGKNLLTKSWSVACASQMRSEEGNDRKKKKRGFLSMLFHPIST
ncbi:Detected protein of unknown function [Hibiscus syriacus]|uniref:Uncharacterized protein n=1 Tax=Hibiscus syriacus TaxID=106335 RepID=A0A6A3ANK1_HIBSY|nr:uncharacterized protein LOC120126279 [Hibiscus syriacus]KAE8704432.1 Detected protein of unknown function [Hibiscus syriacus]